MSGEVVVRLWPREESTAYSVEIPGLDPSSGEAEHVDLGAFLDRLIRRANRSDLTPVLVATFPPGDAETWPLMAYVAFRTIVREAEIFDVRCRWLEAA